MSDTQGDFTRNPETVTHTRYVNFDQTLLSNWTTPVLILTINPGIDQGIAPVILAPQTLFTPTTKEVVAAVVSGVA